MFPRPIDLPRLVENDPGVIRFRGESKESVSDILRFETLNATRHR